MWMVVYPDGSAIESSEHSWLDISERQVVNGLVFDVLRLPAVEIRVQLGVNEAIHRLRSPEPVRFFHYYRGRSGWNGSEQLLYEAIGYCFTGGRIVLEIIHGMCVARTELGNQFSFDLVQL